MRKTVMAAAVALAALFVTPAFAQSPDPAKFYIYYPIVAEGHEGKSDIFAPFPFDTKEACDKFRVGNWSADKDFLQTVKNWANEELEAHDGAVEFKPTYCWRPADGARGPSV